MLSQKYEEKLVKQQTPATTASLTFQLALGRKATQTIYKSLNNACRAQFLNRVGNERWVSAPQQRVAQPRLSGFKIWSGESIEE